MTESEDGDADSEAGNSQYWDEWNTEYRFRSDLDGFMAGQAALVAEIVSARRISDAQILDVGCGTGWLGSGLVPFGTVTGTDLSETAIAEGRRRYPDIELIAGDFMSLELGGPFDFVVSSDSLSPMPDHAAFIERVAALQERGGLFLVMTQNPWVWSRRSKLNALDPSVPNGDVRDWPGLSDLKKILAPYYAIESVSTFMPGGDRGVLFWVENRYVRGSMARLIGRGRWTSLLESMRLGRELVVVASRL